MSPNFDICTECRDRSGFPKQGYPTKREAYKAIKTANSHKQMFLKVYPCPYSTMWHITYVK